MGTSARHRLVRVVTGVFLVLIAIGCTGEPPPSVLVVTLDTLRRDHVGAYGDSRGLTPHLDALAAEGIVHDAAYTTMPTTSPAHASLFTGLLPSEHGVRRNGDPLAPEKSKLELGTRLQRSGWATAAIVTTRLLAPSVTGLRGFEVYDAPQGVLRHGADAVAAALAWLDVEQRRPVLLWVQIYDPHAPYGTADEKRASFPVDPGRYGWVDAGHYADPHHLREMEARYARGVRSADEALGALVAGFRARVGSPPLIVVTADHGEILGERLDETGFAFDHGELLDTNSVAIPLVLAGPGVETGRSPAAVSIRDLHGTVLAHAGLDRGGPVRDVRRRSENRRIVSVERRQFLAPRALVRAQLAAATDGESLAVVGDDGTLNAGSDAADDVIAAARAVAARSPDAVPTRELDPDVRRALRELGYAE